MKSLMSLMVALIAPGLGWAQEKKEADDKKIQGKWEMVRGEQDGNALPEEFVKGFRLTFEGDKYEAKLADGNSEEGKFKLKSDDKPASVIFSNAAGEERKGLYKLSGEELTIVVSDRGGERPKDLSGKDAHLMMVLKKAK